MEKLVSCIMPTTLGRKMFVPLAVNNFLRQDYGPAELVIVDDGPEGLREIIPDAPQIRYRLSPRKFPSLGHKRNFACAQAKGEIILHWDDDDWYAPDWISRQVETLLSNQADVCGLDTLYFFNPETAEAWQYKYGGYNKLPWVAGATLAYRKTLWEKQPFRYLNIGEDNHFVWQTRGRLVTHPYIKGFVSILHPHNTSPKYTRHEQWHPVPVSDIFALLGKHLGNYQCHQEPQ